MDPCSERTLACRAGLRPVPPRASRGGKIGPIFAVFDTAQLPVCFFIRSDAVQPVATCMPERVLSVPLNEPDRPYNLGFTAASLRPELARIVAERYFAAGNWDAAKRDVLATNALQTRSRASAIRLEREFRQRLSTLSEAQLTLLVEATAEDRAAVAWLAALKHSAFIFDFAADVLRDKLAAHDPVLRPSDYESHVSANLPAHPELAELTDSSKVKIRRVLLRMLAEAGLLAQGQALGTIRRPVLSPAVVEAVTSDDRGWLAGFLVPDSEIDRL